MIESNTILHPFPARFHGWRALAGAQAIQRERTVAARESLVQWPHPETDTRRPSFSPYTGCRRK